MTTIKCIKRLRGMCISKAGLYHNAFPGSVAYQDMQVCALCTQKMTPVLHITARSTNVTLTIECVISEQGVVM